MVLEAGCRVIKVKVIKVYSMITLPELDSFPSEQNCVDNPVLDCKLGWWCCFQWSWCHELTHVEAKMLGMRTLRNLISSLSFQLPFCSGVPSKEGEELFCETLYCDVASSGSRLVQISETQPANLLPLRGWLWNNFRFAARWLLLGNCSVWVLLLGKWKITCFSVTAG